MDCRRTLHWSGRFTDSPVQCRMTAAFRLTVYSLKPATDSETARSMPGACKEHTSESDSVRRWRL